MNAVSSTARCFADEPEGHFTDRDPRTTVSRAMRCRSMASQSRATSLSARSQRSPGFSFGEPPGGISRRGARNTVREPLDSAHNPAGVRDNVIEIVLDYLAVRIDPALGQGLGLAFSSATPFSRLAKASAGSGRSGQSPRPRAWRSSAGSFLGPQFLGPAVCHPHRPGTAAIALAPIRLDPRCTCADR